MKDNLQAASPVNFIKNIISDDLKTGKHKKIICRFPPEPNGYLHIGHAKSICLNFGIANEYEGARCHLRFDDTNPEKEDQEYIDAIMEDIKWLGFDWGKHLYYASDYFDKLYDHAVQLIKAGKAYICELSLEETKLYRGTPTEPGKNSPYRDRSIEENLELFHKMKSGDFENGTYTLKAKIDMASPNLNMRDPVVYRIKKTAHPRTGDTWCIYPMYDFTHCLSDSIEEITHSLCTLEFEDHRPLYDWFLDELKVPCHPRQIEFARLNLTYTIMSKRKLLELVNEGHVTGWNDPRMPTISGMRRRGFTPNAIKNFCNRIGVGKVESFIDMSILEDCVREDLNDNAHRKMAVLKPIKVVITNYPEDKEEELTAPNHPQKPEMGERKIPFSKVIYIEQEDFMENPPKKFFRLAPGKEVRLKYGYLIRCEDFIKDEKTGLLKEIHCSYDPKSKGGNAPDGRKVKGTIHWISGKHAIRANVHLYDRLFNYPTPGSDKNKEYKEDLNPNSLAILENSLLEPSLKNAQIAQNFQFERLGYFCLDSGNFNQEKQIFNRIVSLKDSWAKISQN